MDVRAERVGLGTDVHNTGSGRDKLPWQILSVGRGSLSSHTPAICVRGKQGRFREPKGA
jgi:hypothetical protein